MWVYVAILGMILGVGYWVGYPLLRTRELDPSTEPASGDALHDLKIEKEELYSAIKEMEFDHKTGKLSEEDYIKLREKYKTKAINSLKRMDELGGKEDISKEIEDEIEKEVLALGKDGFKVRPKEEEVVFCTQCGERGSPGDRFCSRCGTRLVL